MGWCLVSSFGQDHVCCTKRALIFLKIKGCVGVHCKGSCPFLFLIQRCAGLLCVKEKNWGTKVILDILVSFDSVHMV
jgi:hypothetical protein